MTTHDDIERIEKAMCHKVEKGTLRYVVYFLATALAIAFGYTGIVASTQKDFATREILAEHKDTNKTEFGKINEKLKDLEVIKINQALMQQSLEIIKEEVVGK